MCLDLGATANDLAVQCVLNVVLDLDDNGLVHLVGDNVAAAGLAVAALFVLYFTHLDSPSVAGRIPSSRSRSTV